MARYRLLQIGVHDTQAPAHDITPANYLEWLDYQTWLLAGNMPDPLLAPPPLYVNVAAERVEAFARLDGIVGDKRRVFIVTAVGHSWTITPWFWVTVLTHRAAMPPFPAGFSLPNSARIQVALNNAQLSALVTAISDRLVAINAKYAALVALVNASGAPLTVNLLAGWP